MKGGIQNPDLHFFATFIFSSLFEQLSLVADKANVKARGEKSGGGGGGGGDTLIAAPLARFSNFSQKIQGLLPPDGSLRVMKMEETKV
ncbi:uncharacterized protein CLUP02_09995 [Colletotrichum lupini]|uniref:Uncharacterized protein n=1 Tax=Colletotrichum lupini TaxID=145971 RepID=A0A9Q8SWI5_9PEZI|nr:uncharacterized protein CLUP02_09995 [Colletotrichum lupini]UQC84498.1 hypothetical protein CLUP02_09995 [Colletotrichum lupini]